MGLFSRLTASIHAKSRGPGAWQKGAPEYPGKSYDELRAEITRAVEAHESLKAKILTQIALLDQCLCEHDCQAVKAVRGGQDEKAAVALYRKLLVSRQISRMRSSVDVIGTEQVHLEDMLARLKLKVQAYLAERQKLEKQVPTEDVKLRISEAAAGLGEELAVVSYAVNRAHENAAEAGKNCETATRLTAHCAEPPLDVSIPDQDREPVARALKMLKAGVKAP